MLVIVQNPGMSNFSFTDDQPDPEGAFNVPSINFHPQRTISPPPPPPPPPPCPSAHIHHIHHSPDSSSSLPEHQGPQLRARSNNSGDPVVSTAPPPNESGEVKDTNTNTTGGNKTPDNTTTNIIINDLPSVYANSKNEVVVDVKGLTSYASSFLPFERACGDSRLLHSRSTSALNSQGFPSPHPSSIVWRFSILHFFLNFFFIDSFFSAGMKRNIDMPPTHPEIHNLSLYTKSLRIHHFN